MNDVSEHEKALIERMKKYRQAREVSRRGPQAVNKKSEDAAYTRRLSAFIKRQREARQKALREFDRK